MSMHNLVDVINGEDQFEFSAFTFTACKIIVHAKCIEQLYRVCKNLQLYLIL